MFREFVPFILLSPQVIMFPWYWRYGNVTEFKLQDFKEIKSFIGAEGCIDRYIPISVSVVESPTAEWRIRVEKPFCMTRWHYVSKEVSLFYFFYLFRSNRRPFYSNSRQQSASKALGGTLFFHRLIPEHQVYPHELSRRGAQSRVVQYFSLPYLHSRYPHRALRHLGQRSQWFGAPTNCQQCRNPPPSQWKLVDICVNLGIKPHIHYYNCYPCDRIADLFYQSVESSRLAHP